MKNIFLISIFLFSVLQFSYGQSDSIVVAGNGYHLYGPNSSFGKYLKIGGNSSENDKASLFGNTSGLHLNSKNGSSLYLNSLSGENTFLNTNGGNVGIGTNNPKERLQKVEELTLYTISQEKKIQQQKQLLEQERKKNIALEKRFERIEKMLDKSKKD